VRRVQQLAKAGRLPAKVFGGSLMIEEKDLALVAERKPVKSLGKQVAKKKRTSK
jgi:chemotaxis receptor (MCP) glutamine deamidase CheD